MPRTKQEIVQEIIDRVDIEAEYRSWGCKPTGSPNQDGWLSCHAIGRDDNTPSAGINVGNGKSRGRYKDFGEDGESLSFFYAAAKFGSFIDHKDAMRHYAEQTGVELSKSPKFTERVKCRKLPKQYAAHVLFCRKPRGQGVKPEVFYRLDVQHAMFPAQLDIARPFFGFEIENGREVCGVVLLDRDGNDIPVFSGKGKPPKLHKTHTVSGSKGGLVGGVNRIVDADIVWKVEGITDMLALESIIPEDLVGKHIAITNSGGANERPKPEWMELLAGKRVGVIHDADRPGETGAALWISALRNAGIPCVHVSLPYEIEDKKGKDLRDWIVGGLQYDQLVEIAEFDTEQPQAGDTEIMFAENILAEINIEVLGEKENGHILIQSKEPRKISTIKDIGKLKYENLVQLAGKPVIVGVHRGREDNNEKRSINTVKDAISLIAAQRQITDDTLHGQGCWQIEDASVIVNGGTTAILNGDLELKTVESPIYKGHVLKPSNTSPWCDFGKLGQYISMMDHDKATRTIQEATDLMACYNWKFSHDPMIVTGLIMATMVQSYWNWRPQVAILGDTNTGKTTFFEMLADIFGEHKLMGEKCTEAGLRQAVRDSSCAIILDEFENDKHRPAILELLRTSSRGRHSSLLRGTTDQSGRQFSLKHIAWVAAVNIGFERAPDRNRFIPLDLKTLGDDAPGRLILPSSDHLRDLGVRLMAIMLRHAGAAVGLQEALCRQKYAVRDRVVESFSVPVAAVYAACGGSEGQAVEILARILKDRTDGEATVSDQDELIDDILGSLVDIGRGERMSVSNIMFGGGGLADPAFRSRLEDCGVAKCLLDGTNARRDHLSSDMLDGVFVVPSKVKRYLIKHVEKWRGQDVGQLLERVKGATKARRRVSGSVSRGVLLPIEAFERSDSHNQQQDKGLRHVDI